MRQSKTLRLLATAMIFVLLAIALPTSPVLGALGTISASSSSGPVGTTVVVVGSGFTVNTSFYVRFGTTANVAWGSTGTTGIVSASFTVPQLAGSPSPYTIDVTTDAADTSNILYFTIIPQITLGTTSGYVGASVPIRGTGFYATSAITIYFDGAVAGTISSDANGTFSNATFTVPPAAKGSHTVRATDAGGTSPEVTFNVSQKITITPAAGGVGDKITVSGTGFAANSPMAFFWDADALPTETATTNANGSFTHTTLTVPPTSRGSHTLRTQDVSGNDATAPFTIAHKIAITPTSGVPGTAVTVTGNGFDAGRSITINYNNAPVATSPSPLSTSATGSFTATFNVPAGLPGTFSVEVTDGINRATAGFLATTGAKISHMTTTASPGYVGMEITISGSGFKPSATVTINYAPEPIVLTTTTTDANGVFSATVKIPPSTGGDHSITATDGTTTKSFPFYMEKQPPPIPPPLLPLSGGKAQSMTQFDWEDVTDPSDLTYTLQITINKDFNALLMEKKGLTKSEYTLTEKEKLPSNKKSAPYYWRIKAIDSALNESGWTTPGTFNVGFALELTGGVLYAALGLGGLFLFLIGFLLGRKSMTIYM